MWMEVTVTFDFLQNGAKGEPEFTTLEKKNPQEKKFLWCGAGIPLTKGNKKCLD